MDDTEDPDPARQFLDQTVPREHTWSDADREDDPARPRHIQYPADHVPARPATRRETLRNAAWTFGPGVAYVAASALTNDDPADPAAVEPQAQPESGMDVGQVGEAGGFWASS